MQLIVDGDGIKFLSTRAIIDLLKNPLSLLSIFSSEIILKLLSILNISKIELKLGEKKCFDLSYRILICGSGKIFFTVQMIRK